jgi:hypothetical protein
MAARKTPKPRTVRINRKQEEEQLLAEERAFNRQLEQLLKKYKNQFVAVYKGEVVDHDTNQSLILRRVVDKIGDVPFLITLVSRKPMIFEGPSAEVVW